MHLRIAINHLWFVYLGFLIGLKLTHCGPCDIWQNILCVIFKQVSVNYVLFVCITFLILRVKFLYKPMLIIHSNLNVLLWEIQLQIWLRNVSLFVSRPLSVNDLLKDHHFIKFCDWGICSLNTLELRQIGHFTDDIFKFIFLKEKVWISIKILLNFILNVSTNNKRINEP